MSTPRANDDDFDQAAYQQKVEIIQSIYYQLVGYATRLENVSKDVPVAKQHRTVGVAAKQKAINDLLLEIAKAIGKGHDYTDDDKLYLNNDLPTKIEGLLPKEKDSKKIDKDSAKKINTLLGTSIDKLLGTGLPKILKTKGKDLKERRGAHPQVLDNDIRNFFDRLSFGLFAKVTGRKVVKEIKSQLKLFDKQVKEKEKTEKAEKKAEAKEAKAEEKKERKEQAKKDAKSKKDERAAAKAAKKYKKSW